VVNVNSPVSLSAVIAERMGDVGAHADCVLLVDGAQVDGATIWVDANSVVTCRFGYKFTATGTHSVAVRVQNVAPGDFDPSNNQVSGSIAVQNPVNLFYSVSVYEQTDSSNSIMDSYATADSAVPDQHTESPMTLVSQSRHFSGKILSAVKLPLTKLSYADSTDGKALNSLAYTNVTPDMTGCASDNPDYTTMSIATKFDDATSGWLTLRIYQNTNTGGGLTLVEGGWDAGEVTFVTQGYCNSVAGTSLQCSGGDWLSNPPQIISWGALASLGSMYGANFVVDDGTSYSVSPSIALNTTRTSIPVSTTCSPMDFGGSTPGKLCLSFGQETVLRSGEAALMP
jgi:hypothetical protein